MKFEELTTQHQEFLMYCLFDHIKRKVKEEERDQVIEPCPLQKVHPSIKRDLFHKLIIQTGEKTKKIPQAQSQAPLLGYSKLSRQLLC